MYTLDITDNNACLFVDTIFITEPNPLVVYSAVVTPVSCFGNNDGSIEIINITGGVRPFIYSWTGPNGFTAITENIFNLEAGTYSLTITDVNGCSETFIYIIEQHIYGCMDSEADNYDSINTIDDGSCGFAGCTDALALNYSGVFDVDDGSCIFGPITDDACPTDVDGDGSVTTSDLLENLSTFGMTCN